MQFEEFLSLLDGVKRSGSGYSAKCPAHEDKVSSLSVRRGEDGRILFKCHARCTQEQVVAAMGLTMKDLFPDGDRPRVDRPRQGKKPVSAPKKPNPAPKELQKKVVKQEWVNNGQPVARYSYTDEQGNELGAKLRKEYWEVYQDGARKRDKSMRWEHPIPTGVTIPPYHLPELVKADTVFLVEGEKDVDNLRAQGLAATCAPNGAGGGSKWRDTYTPYFTGKTVYILQDNDQIGKEFAQLEAEKLFPAAKEVKVLDLRELWPELPEKGDISDVMEHMGAAEALAQLLELAERAPGWEPGPVEGAKGEAETPAWCGTKGVNESAFCNAFREKYGDLVCINGVFYDENGAVERDRLLQRITEELSPYVTTRLAQKARDLHAALRSFCYQEEPLPDPTRIQVKGGYVTVDGTFFSDRGITRNRLPVEYDPAAKPPKVFLDYVNALLEPEDVRTLQEFLGYCLVPTTKAQKMLFLIGSGGEGKSVLGAVLAGLFGPSMTAGSLHSLEQNRFALANLEGKLLFLDEDMGVSATRESQTQKRLVTANAPLSIERKGEQPVQALLYCRLLAFGNVPFSTLYDHSEGAFRRRIILTTRPKEPGRKDDKDLPSKILAEKSGVFNWMLEGLKRLITNEWEFTISQQARKNLEESKRDSFNLLGFLEDENAVRLGDLSKSITNNDLYSAYVAWCGANGESPVKQKTVISHLKGEEKRLGIRYTNTARDEKGRRVRGFDGIQVVEKGYIYANHI